MRMKFWGHEFFFIFRIFRYFRLNRNSIRNPHLIKTNLIIGIHQRKTLKIFNLRKLVSLNKSARRSVWRFKAVNIEILFYSTPWLEWFIRNEIELIRIDRPKTTKWQVPNWQVPMDPCSIWVEFWRPQTQTANPHIWSVITVWTVPTGPYCAGVKSRIISSGLWEQTNFTFFRNFKFLQRETSWQKLRKL